MPPIPDHARRTRARAVAAFGLIALPVVGSTFLLPGPGGAVSAAVAAVAATDGSAPLRAAAPAAPFVVEAADLQRAPEAAPPPGATDDAAAVEAFFAAGYSFEDAVELAAGSGREGDTYAVKVAAGRFLAQGGALVDSPFAYPGGTDGYSEEYLDGVFSVWGYTSDDARVLAGAWGVDVAEAKARAGRELKILSVLPFVDPAPPAPLVDDGAVAVFFDSGYSVDDAVAIAQQWQLADPYTAKVKAGGFLRDGVALADSVYADAEAASALTPEEAANLFVAFGHTVEDAEVLAAQWGVGVGEAKVAGGVELKAVGALPFVDVVPPGAGG